ncbi:hypothetical protein, partial [Brevibacillus agri]|uniref:hypothetical protein n=1 Tax=Brevibacillus agri TaxID=51101 RepID=UPI002867B50B
WNWQTHHLEGVAGRPVRVRVSPTAPINNFNEFSKKLLKLRSEHDILKVRSRLLDLRRVNKSKCHLKKLLTLIGGHDKMKIHSAEWTQSKMLFEN